MSESTEEAVLVERRGRVMIITLNRPEAMNAINGALSHGLLNAVQELDADDSLTAGVITGNGRGFCSGMDLKAFARGEDIGPLGTFVVTVVTSLSLRLLKVSPSLAAVKLHLPVICSLLQRAQRSALEK